MTTHVDDGALVRYLDREATDAEREALRAHLDACDGCAARLTRLERRSAALSAALRAAERGGIGAAPSRRWPLRAAAAVLVVLAVGGTVEPVRAWILERAQAIWTALSGGDREEAAPAPAPREAAASVAFVPADGPFTVEIAGRQRAGTLTLVPATGDTARAAVLGGTGAETLVVLPAGLRIGNASSSAASYRVELPARLRPVWVVVGSETPWVFDAGGGPVNVELGGR